MLFFFVGFVFYFVFINGGSGVEFGEVGFEVFVDFVVDFG